MIKLRIEGVSKEVQSFMSELVNRGSMVVYQSNRFKKTGADDSEVIVCIFKHHPSKRVNTVMLHTKDGSIIKFPLLDLVVGEINDGVHIVAGRNFDIFT